MKISIARKTAYEILLRIEKDGSYSSELLAGISSDIDERDAGLIHSLVLGVLRKKYLLDYIVDMFSKTKTSKMDLEVLIILRLGVFQLFFLDRVPGYSAVNEAVELTKFAKKKSASGLVNAVLRKAGSWDGELPGMSELEKLSVETSHPVWLLSKWSDDLGNEQACEIAKANNLEPLPAFRFTSRFKHLDTERQLRIRSEIESKNGVQQSGLVAEGFFAERIDRELRGLFEDGFIYFQDIGSQLIARSVIEKAGSNILDLCAAPGSKSTQIASMLTGSAQITAVEIHFHRAKLLRDNVDRQKEKVGVVCSDGTKDLPFAEESFDTILVDAPCSGTGTIRRNPEIRYKLNKDDLTSLKGKQLSLLEKASKVLKRGGALVYSTCSLEREENEEVVLRFLQDSAEFHIEPMDSATSATGNDGFARLFPYSGESDGFFIACLRRA